jgi:hypothetical protein
MLNAGNRLAPYDDFNDKSYYENELNNSVLGLKDNYCDSSYSIWSK